MKIRTNRIAPLFLAGALAFGVAACDGDDSLETDDAVEQDLEDGAEELEDGAEELEQEMDQEFTDEDEVGDADEDEGVAEDDPSTEE